MVASTRRAAEVWEEAFARPIRDIKEGIGVPVECMALDDVEAGAIGYGANMRRLRAT